MWADFIVEANVLVYALPEMPFRCIFSAVGFFLITSNKLSSCAIYKNFGQQEPDIEKERDMRKLPEFLD